MVDPPADVLCCGRRPDHGPGEAGTGREMPAEHRGERLRRRLKWIRRGIHADPAKTAILAVWKWCDCVIVFPKVHVHASRAASISGAGRLELGTRWDGLRYLPSELNLQRDARLSVDGEFSIYTGFHISVSGGAALTLGSGYINNGVTIDCFKSITIGNRVAISKNVTIRDSDNHSIDGAGEISAPVIIEDDVWIGLNAVILKGVRVGAGSVVAAGAVVTRDVPRNSLVGGVPARVIRRDVTWS
ncbi:acyltransferase (plasmid) [Tundrisphaera lichenicola]|uniref:acyltransferase n=1 Tax=Tundrisphaera lichenicola TaxID=2029860 RepID=UPI003EBE4E48